jgi:hypothetical protein
MLVETMDPVPTEDPEARDGLPALEPVQVAREDEVEALVRAARAGIAMLSLQLRSAQQDAENAEQRADERDFSGARELIDASLASWIESRRHLMAQELEQAREDAGDLVSTAHAEAADVVARASEESLAVLLAGTRIRVDGPAPSLRVVPEQPVEPVTAPAPGAHPSVPLVVTPPVVERAAEPAPGVVVEPAPAREPAVAPSTPAEPPTPVPARAKPLLHLDVLLPMVAVLVVLIVLLAWVG